LKLLFKQYVGENFFIQEFDEGILQQDWQCTYNVKLWCVHVNVVAAEMRQYTLCVVELHVTANYIKKNGVKTPELTMF
jgi:hypothetical protein